jgi:hypothetical protein
MLSASTGHGGRTVADIDLATLLFFAGLATAGWGLVVSVFRGQWRRSWWLFLGGNLLCAGSDIAVRAWPTLAANAATAVFFAWLLWRGRRRKRAPRACGAKSLARVTALARKARETARPRPVRRLVPQGLNR